MFFPMKIYRLDDDIVIARNGYPQCGSLIAEDEYYTICQRTARVGVIITGQRRIIVAFVN